jgi:hypothetical protein
LEQRRSRREVKSRLQLRALGGHLSPREH